MSQPSQLKDDGVFVVARTNGAKCLALKSGTVKATIISDRTYDAIMAEETHHLAKVAAGNEFSYALAAVTESELVLRLGQVARGLELSSSVGVTLKDLAENHLLAQVTGLTYVMKPLR